jgi:soluble P-type ATPase
MKVARLGIVTVQAEGAHTLTMIASDIVVPTIQDALDLFLHSKRLVATLRK